MADKKKASTLTFVPMELKTDEDRKKALETTIAKIEKDFGKGAIMKLGDSNKRENIPVIPTGSLSLDIALGVGGIPRGRIIEVYGPESSGKTTIALHLVAECQKRGGICGYIDAEHALDPLYAKNLGVNIDELYISQPDSGEQALEITEQMVRSCVIDLIVIDSVAALTPRAEIEGDMGDSHMGLQARLMSQALRKLTSVAHKSNCAILFINQLRDKIGGTSYGGNETTTGGRALKFYASVRIDIRKIESLKVQEEFVGSRTRVKIAKNKVAPPFKICHFDIMYGKGISREGDVLDMAVDLNIANKSGAWFSYNGTRLGQGKENAKTFLVENPEVYVEIENAVRKHYDVPAVGMLELTPVEAGEVKKAPKKKAPAKKGEASIEDIEMEELTAGDDEIKTAAVASMANETEEDFEDFMEEITFEE